MANAGVKKIFVGLGNPGEEYENTYHNVGRMALLLLAEGSALSLPGKNPQTLKGTSLRKQDAQPEPWEKYKNLFEYIETGDAIFVRSLTFMNESGKTVREALKKFNAKPENLTVLHDDSDIIIGKYKISSARNSAGHKGVQSIIDALKTNAFIRVRIGIRPAREAIRQKAGEFALKPITPRDKKILDATFQAIFPKISGM